MAMFNEDPYSMGTRPRRRQATTVSGVDTGLPTATPLPQTPQTTDPPPAATTLQPNVAVPRQRSQRPRGTTPPIVTPPATPPPTSDPPPFQPQLTPGMSPTDAAGYLLKNGMQGKTMTDYLRSAGYEDNGLYYPDRNMYGFSHAYMGQDPTGNWYTTQRSNDPAPDWTSDPNVQNGGYAGNINNGNNGLDMASILALIQGLTPPQAPAQPPPTINLPTPPVPVQTRSSDMTAPLMTGQSSPEVNQALQILAMKYPGILPDLQGQGGDPNSLLEQIRRLVGV